MELKDKLQLLRKQNGYCYRDKNGFTYLDSYFGGECFVGEEVVWLYENPVWSMNYAGRVIGGNFSGDFLKEVLMQVPTELPFRGPRIYTKGDYHYHCKVDGEFVWFQGYEEIFYIDKKYMSAVFMEGLFDNEKEELWSGMVDCVTVYNTKDIRVTFRDGTEIKA